jgi:hypothetical protein
MESIVSPEQEKKQKKRRLQTTDPQLAKLYEQEQAIKARISQRLNLQKKAERSAEAQRLIIAGRSFQSFAKRSPENDKLYHQEIDGFCTRPIDRERMGLKPLPGPTAPQGKKT